MKYRFTITLFLNSLPGHLLLRFRAMKWMHLGQSLPCLSIVDSFNLYKESCSLENEQTKTGKRKTLKIGWCLVGMS